MSVGRVSKWAKVGDRAIRSKLSKEEMDSARVSTG